MTNNYKGIDKSVSYINAGLNDNVFFWQLLNLIKGKVQVNVLRKFSRKKVILTGLLIIISACKHLDINSEELSQAEQYFQDIKFISKMPRISGELHHKNVQQMCEERFNSLGFQVETHDYGTGINVIATLLGKQKPAEKIVVSAHYDTVPNCNGADDNASGIAGVFATAKLLATKKHNRTLVVACWDEEEKKTVGSKAYITREKSNNADIKMSYVYEMIGYKRDNPDSQILPQGFELLYPQQVKTIQDNQSRGDFIALVYDANASAFLSDISVNAKNNRLPLMQFEVSHKMKSSPAIPDLRRSDHSVFWDVDYPAVMITDTANFRNQHYHCVNGEDNIASLNIDFALKTINTITEMVEENLK